MKVLLVDDEEDIRTIGRVSLVAIGKLQAVLAASASEALELARAERPDIILMDMIMPGMDGLAALAALQRIPELCRIPVVFMTANARGEDVERYLCAGAAGVIQKPFDPKTLPEQIKRIVQSVNGGSSNTP